MLTLSRDLRGRDAWLASLAVSKKCYTASQVCVYRCTSLFILIWTLDCAVGWPHACSRYSLLRHAAVITWGVLSLYGPAVGTLRGLALLHHTVWRHGLMINSAYVVAPTSCASPSAPARPRLRLLDCCKLHGSSGLYSSVVGRKSGRTAFFTHDGRRSEASKITTYMNLLVLEVDVQRVEHVVREVIRTGRLRRRGKTLSLCDHHVDDVDALHLALRLSFHPWTSFWVQSQ